MGIPAGRTDAHTSVRPGHSAMRRLLYSRRKTQTIGVLKSFVYAVDGVAYILRTQRNARIELAIGIAAVALALWLGLSPLEWAVLAITIALVLALEWINTSL